MIEYRFKTKEEFVKEFGENWTKKIQYWWNCDGGMDYLFGQPYPHPIPPYFSLKSVDGWNISWDMLTENKPVIPDYRRRKLIKD